MHLKDQLKPDSPHNAILRLNDIAEYIGAGPTYLRGLMYNLQRMPVDRQEDISRFFYGWDRGNLTKARFENKWKIVNAHTGHTTLAKMAAKKTPPRPPLKLKIDMSTMGLKVNR